jgi:hypothetical protein
MSANSFTAPEPEPEILDRRVDTAVKLLALIDSGASDQADVVDCAWRVRAIAKSIEARMVPMPSDARLARAVREFLS